MFSRFTVITTALFSTALLTASATAQAEESCGKQFSFVAAIRALEVRQTATPLYDFLASLTPELNAQIQTVYSTGKDPVPLFVALKPSFQSLKSRFNRVECRPGDSQLSNQAIPRCVNKAGENYPARQHNIFLALANEGLHPHLYASSCVREGARLTCLTIDLLNHREDKQELEAAVVKKTREVAAQPPSSKCFTYRKLVHKMSPKVLEQLKQLAAEIKAKKAEGTLPAL